MRLLVVFSLSLLLSKKIVWCVPLNEFYPFGATEDDSLLPRGDDKSSPEITLPSPFPFFDQNLNSVFVNTDGALSFTTKSQHTNQEFPVEGGKMIAPFWADVDTTKIGNVTYRVTTNPELLRRANRDIARTFLDKTFSSSYLLIATWDHVGYYDAQFEKTNTFQAILATNGARSYVIFLYADGEIQWTTGSASNGVDGLGGQSAQVGFNVGDGRHAVIPASRTDAIINITHTSNVGTPGMWVFRVDGEDVVVTAGCQPVNASNENARVTLKLFPRYGSVLGGTAVQVFGPCFDAYAERDIMCSFDGVEVPGLYINKDSVICVSPAMTRLGRVDFALHISGTTMQFAKTTFYSFTIDDASTVEVDSLLYMSSEKLEMTWDHRSLLPEALALRHTVNVVVNIDLVEIDIDSGSTRTIVQLANNVTNSGEYRTRISPKYDGISAAVVRITVADIQIESPADSTVDYMQTFYSQIEEQLAHWSRMFYVSGSNVLQHRCKEWYDEQPDGIGDEILQRLPACPPTESRMTNAFIKEDYGDTYREFFHPSTSSCYRQRVFTRDNQGSGQQCCYDNNGNLATGQPRGGTVDCYAPSNLTGSLNHLRDDILPYVYCCKGELKEYTCDMYYKKRPSDDGSRFILQPPACMYGDPHLVTLDGYKYTFNGKGEFTLIGHKDDIFTVQGRMVEAENSFGLPVNATVFSAVAVKQHNSDTIEFKRSRRGLDTYVNGVMVNFEDLPRQDFNNVALSDLGNQTVSALFSSGAYVKTKAENGIISVLLVSLPDSFYNATYGLMGVFNKNTTDDLMIANSGEYLPLNSTSDTIHQLFGVTWIISENASLFRYSSEESWATYHDPHFISSYNPQFSSPSLENKAIGACDEDEFCLYDVAITGRIEIGLSTLDGSRSLDEMVKLSYPIICDPPCAHGACVANNTCNCAKGYSGARCTEPVIGECDINRCRNEGRCFKMAATHKCDCINGYGGMLCRNKTDDPPTAPTNDGNDDSELFKRPWLIIAAGVAGGVLVILVVFIICIVSCCCHRRYKRRNLTVDSKRINPTNPMYDMNLFLVPDKAKTDTTSSVKPLVPYAADSDRAPANQIQNYANLNSSKREYDTVAIGRDLRMNENPSP